MSAGYEVTIKFATDRPLTDDELGLLDLAVFVQIHEPVNEEGDSAEYTTQFITTEWTPRSATYVNRWKGGW